MAERLDVSRKTIQRDLKIRMDEWRQDIERSTQAYRQSILSELGRLRFERIWLEVKNRLIDSVYVLLMYKLLKP